MTNNIVKKYISLAPGARATHLKIEVYYSLGGSNCYTYRNEKRGYYLSVSPVTREARGGCMMESYTAFTGTKYCVLPVTRQSAKSAAQAVKMAEDLEQTLIAFVCRENALEVAQ